MSQSTLTSEDGLLVLRPASGRPVFSTGRVLELLSDLSHYAAQLTRVGGELHDLAIEGALTFRTPIRVPDEIARWEVTSPDHHTGDEAEEPLCEQITYDRGIHDECDSGDETEAYSADADYPDDIKTDASDLSANSTCGMLSCVFVCVSYSSMYA